MRLPAPALPWLAALLAAAVYLPALSSSFQFDDWQVVLDDSRVASLAAWWNAMPGMRALVKLSYALNHGWSDRVETFRAVNLLLHAVNAALVFVLVRDLAQRFGTPAQRATIVAVVGTLVFAWHPVQTESVTYIAARPNLLAALFCLLSLITWLRGREQAARWWWPLSALCYVAALASKETAAVLPLAMVLCLAAEGRIAARELRLPVALCGLLGVLLLAAWSHFPYDYLLRTSLETRAPVENLVAQVQGVGWLLGQLLRWDLLNADPALQPSVALTLTVLLQGMALICLLVAGLITVRSRPALSFGILWFFLWLAPTNSLLARLDLANDRQLYVALIGPAWCLGHAASLLGRRAGVPIAVLALLLAVGTLSRNRVYATEVTFWHDVTAKSPHNVRAWNNLGMAQALDCNVPEAARAFGEAIRRDPGNALPQVNLALLEQRELPGMQERCR